MTAVTALSDQAGKHGGPALPLPLVKPFAHPLGWMRNTIQSIFTAAIGGYLGLIIVAGLYFLLFETNASMTHAWHSAVSDAVLRHNIRDVGEGLLGGLLGKFLVWNHYRKLNPTMNKLDLIEERLHIANRKDDRPFSVGQLLASPFLVMLYALPGLLLGSLVIWLARHGAPHVLTTPRNTSFWQRQVRVVTSNWSKKVLGLGGSLFFGRRPVKGVFDDLQEWIVERHIVSNRKVHWFYPPAFQARYNDLNAAGVSTVSVAKHPGLMRVVLVATLVVSIGLAGTGWYVLTFIAH